MKNSKFILAAVLLLAAPAAAQDLRTQLGSCLAIPGVLQRLSCYDGIAKGVAPAPIARAPAQAQMQAPVPQAYRPVVAAAPAAQFGSERLPQSMAERQRGPGLVSEIVKFENSLRGKFTITLANGQVWKQIDGDDAIARPRRTAHTVTIERAVFGSYALSFNDSPQRYKVTRIQ